MLCTLYSIDLHIIFYRIFEEYNPVIKGKKKKKTRFDIACMSAISVMDPKPEQVLHAQDDYIIDRYKISHKEVRSCSVLLNSCIETPLFEPQLKHMLLMHFS